MAVFLRLEKKKYLACSILLNWGRPLLESDGSTEVAQSGFYKLHSYLVRPRSDGGIHSTFAIRKRDHEPSFERIRKAILISPLSIDHT